MNLDSIKISFSRREENYFQQGGGEGPGKFETEGSVPRSSPSPLYMLFSYIYLLLIIGNPLVCLV